MWDRIRDFPARAAVRFAVGTGFARSVRPAALPTLLRSLASGSQNPAQIYRFHARNQPDARAIVFGERVITWAELDDRIDRFASAFRRRGLKSGQRVLLMMRNRPEHIELAGALARANAAAVAISWRSTADELVYLATHSGARGLVIDRAFLPVLEDARARLAPELLANVFVPGESLESLVHEPPMALDDGADDAASVVIYTSGTTGKPKGAVRTFPKDTMRAAFRFVNATPLRHDDVHVVACPLYHSTAFGFTTLATLLGNTLVILDEFEPRAFLDAVVRHRATTTALVPTMLHRILDVPFRRTPLRVVFAGGAPLPAPLALAFMDAYGDVLHEFYGATETGLVTLATPADLRAAPGTIGRALPGNDIRLLDPKDGIGELFVKNDLLVAGYNHDDEATRASMRDGYFSVGDLARRDREGRYFLEGRKRDMIISGGVNVYPAEVEATLEAHPDVVEVAVVGVPDQEWGEKVCAFVVVRPDAPREADALRAFAKARLSGPKVPRGWIFVDQLPRNPTGKVLKRELRERTVG